MGQGHDLQVEGFVESRPCEATGGCMNTVESRKAIEYGCAIERPASRAYSVLNLVYAIAIVALVLAIAFQGAPS